MEVATISPESAGHSARAYLTLGDQVAPVDVGASPHVVDAIRGYTPLLNSLVLTHRHDEHAAMLDRVCESFDVDVYAFDPPDEVHPALRHAVADGDRIRIGDEPFDALHTPSHSADHLVYIGGSVVFGGDLVLSPPVEASTDRSDLRHASPDRRRTDLERLLEHIPASAEVLYAGHGEPMEDPRVVVQHELDKLGS